MEVLEEIRAELSALADTFPKGVSTPELAGYFGVPLRQIEPAINALEMEGAVCLNGETVSFQNRGATRLASAREAGRKGGLAASREAMKDDVERRAKAFGLRRAIQETSAEYGIESPSLEESVRRVRDALPLLAEYYPHGVSAAELSSTLMLHLSRAYAVIKQASDDGWCEQVRAYGHRKNATVAVFEGMMVPAPLLTDLQQRVLNWIKEKANGATTVEVNMTQCASDIDVSMIQDKLDSMERKGFIARLTPYRERGKNGSPLFEILPEPQPRAPTLWKSPTAVQVEAGALMSDIEERGFEAVSVEPIAVRRARTRKRAIEVELKQINEFLKTYDRLSK